MSPAAFLQSGGICSGIFRLQPRGGGGRIRRRLCSERAAELRKISCSVKMHASLCILYKYVFKNSGCVFGWEPFISAKGSLLTMIHQLSICY